MFCANCGKQLSDNALFCPDCGEPTKKMNLPTQPPAQYNPPGQPYYPGPATTNVNVSYPTSPQASQVSGAWWLAPFFLGFLGGLIGYFAVKSRNPGMAKNLLIFGIIWSIILGALSYLPLLLFRL